MKRCRILIIFLPVVLLLAGCKKEASPGKSTYAPTPHEFTIPPGFPNMIIPPDNPATEEGILLGRMLFYDPIIDFGSQRSCGQCHVQGTSFSSPGVNSLHLINLAWNNAFLWNGKVEGVLEEIMLFEVEEFFYTDVDRLNEDYKYRGFFRNAFGTDTITSKEVAYALAQFIRSLITSNSKWDKVLKGEAALTPEEDNGRKLFYTEKADCFHCHGTILFTDNFYHNNGLDSLPAQGREEVTGDPDDRGRFKSPTLRNIGLTAPYMHDGRFKTLEEVITFYSEQVKWSPTIDPLMKKVNQGGVHLTPQEKLDLLSFLKTLTDTAFVSNPAFSDPY